MSQQGTNRQDKEVCCISCGKLIAKGYMEKGSFQILCKCGVLNRIEALQRSAGRQTTEDVQQGRIIPV